MTSRTLLPTQLLSREISALKPSKYKCWNETISASSAYVDNEYDIGAALKAKYGTEWDVPATNGFIMVSDDIKIKLNSTDEDEIELDVSAFGNVWSFNHEDLLISKIYFKGGTGDIDIEIFAAGSEFIHLAEEP